MSVLEMFAELFGMPPATAQELTTQLPTLTKIINEAEGLEPAVTEALPHVQAMLPHIQALLPIIQKNMPTLAAMWPQVVQVTPILKELATFAESKS